MHGQGLPRPTLAITCATDDNNNNGDVTTMMIGHNDDDDADVFPQSRKVAANAAPPPLSRGQRLAVLKAATRQCCHHVRWVPLSPGTQAVTIHGALHLHMGHCAHALCAIKRLRNAGHV